VCITTYQPNPKSNPNPNPNPNPTTKQHSTVNIQLNIVTCPTYPDKFIRDNVVAPSVLVSIVIAHCPEHGDSITISHMSPTSTITVFIYSQFIQYVNKQ